MAERRRTSRRKARADSPAPAKSKALQITVEKGQTNAEAVARKLLGPVNRHGNLAPLFGGAFVGRLPEDATPGIVEYANELQARFEKVRTGDLAEASDLLLAQSLTLDGIFTEMARRAACNLDQYPAATELFMRLALKAQAQSRASVEALARLHQPREQTVRHVHVNEGGQAIVADEFHTHTGGTRNGNAVIQSHEPSSAPADVAPLLGHDATGNGLPVPGDQRPEALPVARRQGRRTNREQ